MRKISVLSLAFVVVSAAGCSDNVNEPSTAPTGACGASYPHQTTSPYVLPWKPGASFTLGQGSCTGADGSHAAGTDDEYALDVDMPIGTKIIAARAGKVLTIEGRFIDGNRTSGQENYIQVLHIDGTMADYFHLTKDGPQVAAGDAVSQGQLIGLSGDTGDSTEPHLHFQVDSCATCGSIPVTFRNTRPHPKGLIEGESYTAQ
jgi:murein DD-endopeptidase MepM/ murein hydrolase activator NlpD